MGLPQWGKASCGTPVTAGCRQAKGLPQVPSSKQMVKRGPVSSIYEKDVNK